MQKLYYSISEVSSIVDEEQHILRYWEKEFEGLRPKKNRGGNRIYSEKDLNIVRVIKILLREDMLSLKGAKEQLKKIIWSNSIEEFIKEKEADIHSGDNKKKIKEKVKTEPSIVINDELLKDIASVLRESLNYLKSI